MLSPEDRYPIGFLTSQIADDLMKQYFAKEILIETSIDGSIET